MQEHTGHVALVVISHSDLEVMVPSSSDEHVLAVELGSNN
jgi:hypothetical protein